MKIALNKLRYFILISLVSLATIANDRVWSAPLLHAGQGSALHVFEITVPDKELGVVDIMASAKYGAWSGGHCEYKKTINLGYGGFMYITAGRYYITSDEVKSSVGGGYTCATYTFTYTKPVEDSFQLIWDAKADRYTQSIPPTSHVDIK